MKKKHNYPKHRKARDTSYSLTQQLIKHYGVDRLKEIYMENKGIYGASNFITQDLGTYISYTITQYLARKFQWVRIVNDPNEHKIIFTLAAGFSPEYYKHLKFSEEILNEVFHERRAG
ncbi:MAG: hypothetical protein ACM34M_14630 [Ignavibacteria bacterium]